MTDGQGHIEGAVEARRFVDSIQYADPEEVKRGYCPNVELIIEPGKVMQWPDFQATAPPNSIAIDGYVEGQIRRDLDKHVYNLNHHEDVDRYSTFATCQQAQAELRAGLLSLMSVDGEFSPTIFANDCDEDVCTTVFVLRHAEFAAPLDNQALNRLVEMEGHMDRTNGFYPFPPEYPSLGKFYWVFEPYHDFKNSGGVARQNRDEFQAIIDEVGRRIELHITGQGESIELDPRFEVLEDHGNWHMVRDIGKHAKVGILAAGIQSYISVLDLGDGKFKYAVGRLSPTTPFDIPGLFAYMNGLEGLSGQQSWGGHDSGGGSPRNIHSKIPPSQMSTIMPMFVKSPMPAAS